MRFALVRQSSSTVLGIQVDCWYFVGTHFEPPWVSRLRTKLATPMSLTDAGYRAAKLEAMLKELSDKDVSPFFRPRQAPQ